jgi:hypothetical protein
MPCNGHVFKFVMQTDYIGNEISWKLNDRDQQIAGGSDYPNNSLIEVTRCVDGGIHTFSITDTFGDGICCQYGPGWYQIWYDGVIIHDSDGKYGREEIISFTNSGIVESPAPSTAPPATDDPSPPPSTDRSVPYQTHSPIQTPQQDSVYGIYCRGVCPSGTLADPYESAQFSDGRFLLCASLDQQYKELFLTLPACNQLALSAQGAGCQCTEPATSVVVLEESSKEGLENNPKFGISGWIYVSLAVLSMGGIICLIRRTISFNRRAEEEAAQGNESSPSCDTTKPQKMGSDLAGSDQSKLNGRSYLQSWVLWAENSADNSERDTTQNSERDNQTVDETIFEDVSSALFEDVPSAL